MTLVLAKERTLESLREALFANRTIAWFGDKLAGKEEYLAAFFKEAVSIKYYDTTKKGKNYIVKNSTDVRFILQGMKGLRFMIPANGETMIMIPKGSKNRFRVRNLYIRGKENLRVVLDLKE